MSIYFFLFFLLSLSTAQDDCTSTTSKCSDDGPPIRFPFRLKNQHPPHCGYPGFDLSCSPNNTTTVLDLPNSVKVLVTHIDYKSRLIHIKDPNGCFPQQLQNLNLSTTPFNFPDFVDDIFDDFVGDFGLFSCPPSTKMEGLYWLSGPNYQVKSYRVTCLRGGDGRDVYFQGSGTINYRPELISCRKMYNVWSVPYEVFDETADLQLQWLQPNPPKKGQSSGRPFNNELEVIVESDFIGKWTGSRSFNHRSLHHIGSGLNPYEQAISIIGKTLSAFDKDNLIPCFGFGDASTHDQEVFSFDPEERYCNEFEEVVRRYREIVPHLKLLGPTSFALVIEMAMSIVEESGGQYHVLLIVADGQMTDYLDTTLTSFFFFCRLIFSIVVTRSVDTAHGKVSPQEQNTIDAIIKASEYPLSIILVGVGDGPWDTMREFDDNIPCRAFDNFQVPVFVNFTEIMSKNVDPLRKQTEFALSALMEIPSQYKATLELSILGRRTGNAPKRVPLPPPRYGVASTGNSSKPYNSSSFQKSTPPYQGYDMATGTAPYSSVDQVCPICLTNLKDMAFACGHQVSYSKSTSRLSHSSLLLRVLYICLSFFFVSRLAVIVENTSVHVPFATHQSKPE
ncbi:hypothetical protein RHGRI_027476 [Rhododendron griersonianum]|uniref:Uncharacterized protein n=1 Tax=Rhododendron griersonianum TaxID=479676 RepID=A0AAV6IWP1_9ERIC|nr:hypothetical protein RHGRI_027476 [Rhododendron griersonianum]